MSSDSIQIPSSQTCVRCGRNRWLLHAERFLSTTCMGWCLQTSFMEDPKLTTIAYAGGASSLLLTNFLLNHRASQPRNRSLLRAGGLISVAGIAWCLQMAIDEHPTAAIKACLAGALSFCLTKAVIFSDTSAIVIETPQETAIVIDTPQERAIVTEIPQETAIVTETPQEAAIVKETPQERTIVNETPGEIKTVKSVPDLSEMYYSLAETPAKVMNQIELIGKQLNQFCEDYYEQKIASVKSQLGGKFHSSFIKKLLQM